MSFTRYIMAASIALALGISVQASAAENATAGTAVTTQSSAMPSTEKAIAEKVNINAADAGQLMSLKGIGDSKAQSIIDYRTEHGAFKSVDELANVKGISQKTLATLLKNNPGRIVVE